MSELMRWTPTSSVFDRAFGPLFNRTFGDFTAPWAGHTRDDDVGLTNWAPATDIKETDDALFVYVELPGMKKDDIDISLESGMLTVSGERRFTKDEKTKEDFHRVERFYGKFTRSFRLPRNVDSGKVKASYADGLLTLELPKTEEARPRQIEIK